MGGHLINLVFSAGLPRRGVWGHGPAPHQGPAAPRLRRGRRQGQKPQGLRQRRGARERERVWASLSPPPSLSPFPLYISPPSPPPSLPISLLTRRRLSCPAAGGRGAGGAAQGGVGVGSGAGPGGGLRLGEARHQVARDEKRRERDRSVLDLVPSSRPAPESRNETRKTA